MMFYIMICYTILYMRSARTGAEQKGGAAKTEQEMGVGAKSRTDVAKSAAAPRTAPRNWEARVRGNHLSSTTCLTQVFFKSGE